MAKIQKTTFVITVLHTDDERPNAPSIEQLAKALDDGPWIGQMEQKATVPVPAKSVCKELLAIGNDGTFFDCEA